MIKELTFKTWLLHTSNISRIVFVQLRNYRVLMVVIMRHARYSVPVFVDVHHLTLQYDKV